MKTFSLALLVTGIAAHSAHAYELHEWGTFTTVSGSDGVLLSGLQREEEELPSFVHSHFGFENGGRPDNDQISRMIREHGRATFDGTKGLGSRPVAGVTVKMETPVIYFHSPAAFRAKVKVGFNGGTISQWYPARSAGEVLPEPPPSPAPRTRPTPASRWLIDFSKGWQGSIEWDVDVLAPEESSRTLTFKPGDSVNWLRARVPEANNLRVPGGEVENYLFYRGVGNFDTGLLLSASADETLHLHNTTGGHIPYLLVYDKTPQGKVRWKAFENGLADTSTLDVPEASFTLETGAFSLPLYESLRQGILACGLTRAEADAMIQTWWKSYFDTPGTRVFWILPESSTHRILPLTVTPAPDKIARVIVGRSEILRPREEAAWLALSRDKKLGSQWTQLVSTHRFGLAIEERVGRLGHPVNGTTTPAKEDTPSSAGL